MGGPGSGARDGLDRRHAARTQSGATGTTPLARVRPPLTPVLPTNIRRTYTADAFADAPARALLGSAVVFPWTSTRRSSKALLPLLDTFPLRTQPSPYNYLMVEQSISALTASALDDWSF